jgi:hypothetical protein
MWYWVDPRQWKPISVTAWVPGPTAPIWSTTTATPRTLSLAAGNGDVVACTSAGTRWTASYGDETPSPSGCQYTYRHSSLLAPNGIAYDAEVTIAWDVSWRSSSGAGGSLGTLQTSTDYDITVREIQAVVVA